MNNRGFDALRKAYGFPETSTIKGLIRYLKRWIERDESAPSDGLVSGCREMARKLEIARIDTQRELKTTGETDAELSEPVLRSIEAYQEIKEIVLDIANLAESREREGTQELLEELEDAAQYLKEAQEDLVDWLSHPTLRCPRCGAADEDPCPSCALELLYPNPNGGSGAKDPAAYLPQEYGAMFQAYISVRDGELTLSHALERTSPAVKRNVDGLTTMVNASLVKDPESETLLETQQTLASLAEGLERMNGTRYTRKMADLQDGWLMVFRNAVKLEELRHSLLEEFGGEADRAQVREEKSSRLQQDRVHINGDR